MSSMHWHAEPSTLLLRGYDQPGGYALRLAYGAVAHVKLLGAGVAYIEGALRNDGQPLSPADWRDVARLLAQQHQVEIIEAVRHGRRVSWPTGRAR
ncbi:hypothetical protein [Roseateles cavernae]|uniref:hypothetical protein n=1 Tax=Roseateles cavernae TaxID=3153578 RepID=UPI0032E4A600